MPIVLIVLLLVFGAAAAGTGAALFGEAPRCASEAAPARAEPEIGDIVERLSSVVISEGEATSLARAFVKDAVDDARICFTPGLAHASGKLRLGPVAPSFYASAGIDLSGSAPRATNLEVKVGALPDLPLIAAQVNQGVSGLVNEKLGQYELEQRYTAEFTAGKVTIRKGGP